MPEFYSELADDYDSMTRFDTRLETVRNLMKPLVDTYSITSALDVACGTGIGTLALAQLGVQVTGTDLNGAMIQHARTNAAKWGVPKIPFSVASMGDTFDDMPTDLDAIFCLGNSIPHILDPVEFVSTCRHFHSILKPGGRVFIQLKNFEMLLTSGERFVNANRQGTRDYIRFYDFLDDTVAFNILRLDWTDTTAKHNLITTTLNPYLKGDFETVMTDVGFSTVEAYANLKLAPFVPDTSSDILIVATR